MRSARSGRPLRLGGGYDIRGWAVLIAGLALVAGLANSDNKAVAAVVGAIILVFAVLKIGITFGYGGDR